MNRTLLDMERCMLLEVKLPERFWVEAINTAVHTRNRCPNNALKGEVPFYLWKGKRPTVSYFKTFGSRGFVLNKIPNKGKFQQRSKPCIFLGYFEESKGYQVWLINENKFQIARDVKTLNEPLIENEEDLEKDENNSTYLKYLIPLGQNEPK